VEAVSEVEEMGGVRDSGAAAEEFLFDALFGSLFGDT
jgi:hypothetical protein